MQKLIIIILAGLLCACATLRPTSVVAGTITVDSLNGPEKETCATLEEARTRADTLGKTIHVRGGLSAEQSNILGPWPTNRGLIFEHGGSMNPNTVWGFAPGAIPSISPEWFGGNNDTALVQQAVNVSKASGWIPVAIPRVYTLVSSVFIDRPVDGNTNEFRIIAAGANAGFYTSSGIWMFSSSIPHTLYPVSEFISFEGVKFEASSNSLAAWVTQGDKFLRMKFNGCSFIKIKCAATANYLQSWNFLNRCQVLGISGFLLSAAGDVNDSSTYSLYIGASDMVNPTGLLSATGNIAGSSFISTQFEDVAGPFIQTTAGFLGGFVQGYYENVTNSVLKLGASASVDIVGSVFNTSTASGYYAVDCGTSYGVTGSGNFAAGNLYKDDLMTVAGGEGLISQGDFSSFGNVSVGLKRNNDQVTGTVTGFTVSNLPTTLSYHRSGSSVTLSWTDQSGTSNSGAMGITGLPAALLPTSNKIFPVRVLDGSTNTFGVVVIGPGGIGFGKNANGDVFGSSGTKGILATTVTYNLWP
jgi:hypothetical protein